MKKSGVVLENKEIFGVNKVHKNVLRPMPRTLTQKSRVYYDPSEEDPLQDVVVDQKMLELVTENIKFDNQVIKSKAQHTVPYTPSLTREVFSNELAARAIHIANQHRAPSPQERLRRFKIKSVKFNKSTRDDQQSKEEGEIKRVESKFTPVSYFKSVSEENLKGTSSTNGENNTSSTINVAKSLDELNTAAAFITESVVPDSEWDWDCQLIDGLSENTARWMVMKKIERDVSQKEKLSALVEDKFGRFTRNIDDLDLFEDSLTEFEKQKIKEEKDRFREEKRKKKQNKLGRINKSDETKEKSQVPLYRLPQGLKHVELEKLKMPDPNFNSTAKNIQVVSARVESPQNYSKKMEKVRNISDMTIMKSDNAYINEMLNKKNSHVFTTNEEQIVLKSGPAFKKDLEQTYPVQFTQWVANVDLTPPNKPQLKRPMKGKRRWKNLPDLIVTDKINEPIDITVENNYWHLMPTTVDTELRKVLGSNLTVAKIINEWRKKWQTSTRWTQAEIDELLADMSDDSAHIRFQALVICSRAIENTQQLKSKFEKFARKTSEPVETRSNDYNDSFALGKPLFNKIISLLSDSNHKCRLAASIAVFTWLRGRSMPLSELNQTNKDQAEIILREALNGFDANDKFTAALCLSNIGGMCDRSILEVLIENYFNAREQYTREQVVRSLAYLSNYFPNVTSEIGSYLWSNQVRERMLACKLLPSMHTTITQKITDRLIEMMWNDTHRQARKLAAQTLGRTGRGRFVHDEIHARLSSTLAWDRIEALEKIDQIGIMTNKMIGAFLKCFRDDYVSVRELACKACQNLSYDKSNQKLVEALVFVARFDRATKLKALAIRTLGLIGDGRAQIRNCLLWAVQFEKEPLIRTEACHSLVLLVNDFNDNLTIDVLIERNFVEEELLVRKEIRDALVYFGRDPNKELPVVTKIKADIKKLNDKKLIIQRIYEMEKEEKFQIDKKLLIGEGEAGENDDGQPHRRMVSKNSLKIFEPRKMHQQGHRINPKLMRPSFLSKLVFNMDQPNKDIDSPQASSGSSSISIDFSPHQGLTPELDELNKKTTTTTTTTTNSAANSFPNREDKAHHFDTIMVTAPATSYVHNPSHAKASHTSLSKHIDTIVEETA